MSDGCPCLTLRPSPGFEDLEAFRVFQRSLDGEAYLEISVGTPYANIGEQEWWYRCQPCGDIWRLVEPDGPFAGVWRRVPVSELGDEDNGTSGSPAPRPNAHEYLFVYDRNQNAYPVRFWVRSPDDANSAAPSCFADLDGAIYRDAVEVRLMGLRQMYPEPRYAVACAHGSTWETIALNFPGLYDG